MTQVDTTIGTASERQRMVATLVTTFSADPLMRWFYPDPRAYLAHFPGFIERFAGRAFEEGTADSIDGVAGAALWLPPGVRGDDDALIAFMQASMSEEQHDALGELAEQLDRYHPDEPHWYLALLGIDPPHQSRGFGAEMIRPRLEQCDREGRAAHLVSSTSRNHSFYRRHGFEIMDEVQVGDAPPVWPMLRSPR